ncbi:MAG: ECF transporter S component [Defluviitaleaceae bacterium]|nr:ECF transporter S component [Defluviitaleaceae bacterium]
MNRTKKLTTLAMLTSMAYLVGAMFRLRGVFAAAPFLTYDPKDVVILMGGFMFGPLSALAMSVIVALLEMATISVSGLIGAAMNALSSASFACTAAYVYSKKKNLQGAVLGLALAVFVVTGVMLLWNYLMIPLYTPQPRSAVVNIMLPALLPFNLIKASLNASIALLLYKKISEALKSAGLYIETSPSSNPGRLSTAVMMVSAVITVVLVAILFIIRAAD